MEGKRNRRGEKKKDSELHENPSRRHKTTPDGRRSPKVISFCCSFVCVPTMNVGWKKNETCRHYFTFSLVEFSPVIEREFFLVLLLLATMEKEKGNKSIRFLLSLKGVVVF